MRRLLLWLLWAFPQTQSFNHFRTMPRLQALVRSTAFTESTLEVVVDVKSLVWLHDDEPLIVVVDPTARVNKQALVAHLKANAAARVRLAPPNVAVELTGYPIGRIPPAFHATPFVRTLVDEALVARLHPSARVVCTSHADGALGVATLLGLPGVEVAPVSFEAFAATLKGLVVGSDSALLSMRKLENAARAFPDAQETQRSSPMALPYFPADLQTCENASTRAAVVLQPVAFACRVASVRRMARTLAFISCDPVTESTPPFTEDVGASAGLPADTKRTAALTWRCVSDGLPMAVQLIIGRTFMGALGEEAGVAKLRAVKDGQVLVVRGAVGKNAEWGAANWHSHRGCDVVVSGFDVLPEAAGLLRPPEPTAEVSVAVPAAPTRERRADDSHVDEAALQAALAAFEGSFLTLEDILAPPPRVVDDAAGIAAFARAVAESAAEAAASRETQAGEDAASALPGSVAGCWGFDAEWQPSNRLPTHQNQPGGDLWEAPVALLQLATAQHCFLIDLQTLLSDGNTGGSPLPFEASLNEALGALLSNPSLLKVSDLACNNHTHTRHKPDDGGILLTDPRVRACGCSLFLFF